MSTDVIRPFIEELRLSAFKSYRRAVLPLGRFTVLHGPSGAGKSNALDALAVLSRLAVGEPVGAALSLPALVLASVSLPFLLCDEQPAAERSIRIAKNKVNNFFIVLILFINSFIIMNYSHSNTSPAFMQHLIG